MGIEERRMREEQSSGTTGGGGDGGEEMSTILDHIQQFEEEVAADAQQQVEPDALSDLLGADHPLHKVIRDAEESRQDSPKDEPKGFQESTFEIPEVFATRSTQSFNEELASLNPVGWWRLDDEPEPGQNPEAWDHSGHDHHGDYSGDGTGPFYQQKPGAIATDQDDVAVGFLADERNLVEVADSKLFSLTRAHDDFNRDHPAPENPYGVDLTPWDSDWANSWGSSSGSGEWYAQVSTGAYYRCVRKDYTDDKNGRNDPEHPYGFAQIDQRGASGTFQQGLDTNLLNGDLQVRASWDAHPAVEGSFLRPVALVARMQDTNNFYRAEIRENSDSALDLRILRTSGGVTTEMGVVTNIGIHEIGDRWYLRFQFDGNVFRAKAWRMDELLEMEKEERWPLISEKKRGVSAQPAEWMLTVIEDSRLDLVCDGSIAIRSANSGSGANPIVTFERFRAQSLGFTVHAWMRPDAIDFHVPVDDPEKAPYTYWLGAAAKTRSADRANTNVRRPYEHSCGLLSAIVA